METSVYITEPIRTREIDETMELERSTAIESSLEQQEMSFKAGYLMILQMLLHIHTEVKFLNCYIDSILEHFF